MILDLRNRWIDWVRNGLQSDFELQTACELVCSEELLLILTLGQSIGGAVKNIVRDWSHLQWWWRGRLASTFNLREVRALFPY